MGLGPVLARGSTPSPRGASPRTPWPGTPRWPTARFLRHRAGALSALVEAQEQLHGTPLRVVHFSDDAGHAVHDTAETRPWLDRGHLRCSSLHGPLVRSCLQLRRKAPAAGSYECSNLVSAQVLAPWSGPGHARAGRVC